MLVNDFYGKIDIQTTICFPSNLQDTFPKDSIRCHQPEPYRSMKKAVRSCSRGRRHLHRLQCWWCWCGQSAIIIIIGLYGWSGSRGSRRFSWSCWGYGGVSGLRCYIICSCQIIVHREELRLRVERSFRLIWWGCKQIIPRQRWVCINHNGAINVASILVHAGIHFRHIERQYVRKGRRFISEIKLSDERRQRIFPIITYNGIIQPDHEVKMRIRTIRINPRPVGRKLKVAIDIRSICPKILEVRHNRGMIWGFRGVGSLWIWVKVILRNRKNGIKCACITHQDSSQFRRWVSYLPHQDQFAITESLHLWWRCLVGSGASHERVGGSLRPSGTLDRSWCCMLSKSFSKHLR